jgi:hydroxymethylglutaryl-CoA lyase
MNLNMPEMSDDKPSVKFVECPRDAMQGWKTFIPTHQKVAYIQQLLKVGFHTLDFGSFVSSKLIPQMADTKEVLSEISLEETQTKLLAIVANVRGAEEAAVFEKISYLGFPFSISPTFQMRNTHSTIEESLEHVKHIHQICQESGKELVVYISMAFGNPYGDEYDENVVLEWVKKITADGIQIISLADTVGIALPYQVASVVKKVKHSFSDIETGVHLHSTFTNWQEKTDAALNNGCLRFDGSIKGIGGCPMANDELVGNMDSELLVPYFSRLGLLPNINLEAMRKASAMASEIFI